MSFLERIFGKKKGTAPESMPEKKEEEQIFSIDDAENYLSKKFDEKFEPFKEDAKKIYQDMQPVADNMRKSMNELAKSEFSGPVDSELLQNVVAHRKSFIHKMDIMLEELRKPMQLDFDSILEYGQSLSSAVFEANQKTVKDYHFLKELFEREADNAIENFKIITKMSDDLKNLINSKREGILSIRNMQNELKLVKEGIGALSRMEENLGALSTEISGLKSEQENEKEKVKEFESGEEWIHFTELLEKKKDTAMEISNLKSQITQDMFKIEKPLKRLKNLVDKEIVKVEDKKALGKYASSFYDAMMEERNPETINSILEMIQKNISEGKIDLKDREKADEIKWILENNVFGNFLEKYLQLEDDLKELEKMIGEQNAPNAKSGMYRRIEDLGRQMEAAGLEVEKVKKQMDKTKNSIDERKIALEKSLTLFSNKKIKLS